MLETAETVAVILDFIFSNPIHHSAGLTGMYLIVGFISIGSVVIVILFGGVILKPSREIKDDARSLSTFLRQDDDIP